MSAYRLPPHIRPTSYRIDLAANPDAPEFSGRVEMRLSVELATERIELHARDLAIDAATLLLADGTEIGLDVDIDAGKQVVRFFPPSALAPGEVTLRAAFRGTLSTSMHGLYLATDGQARAVCSQCEATDARAIFPCFDEPAFKATIAWTIRTPSQHIALTNGDQIEVTTDGEDRVWRFAATRPVSSYLAAVVIGDFEGTEPREVDGTPLSVYAPTGKLAQTDFALDYTARLLPWYERYFAIRYPFGKYDQVAVPGFDAGAMENVGLVLFRQNLLLMDPSTASWRQEKLIAKVIAHEFAHMWFGNLVTMQWWDDLWLNEAFAEWMAHKACNALSPDYRVWDDFQDDKNRALVDDALPTTHPIWTEVDTPEQALEMFDVITYQKGCAVMRMLENFLGDASFCAGLRTYMETFAYKNAAGDDLWSHLEAASGQPVAKLMKSWITVSGFPLVTAALEDGDSGPALRLTQARFFSSASAPADTTSVWSVPVVVRFEDDEGVKRHRFILSDREHVEQLPAQGAVKWCYPNADEIGFYRCHTEGQLARALLERGLPRLTPIEQMGLIEDQWALVRNRTSTIDRFLAVLNAFARSGALADHNVLRAVVDRMGTIERLLEDAGAKDAETNFRAWVKELLSDELDALGFDPRPDESQNDLQRRALLVHAMAQLARDPEAIAAAVHRADRERQDPASVDPNLAGTFLYIAARAGDDARYATWIDTYGKRKDSGAPPQITLRYLYTLAAFRPEALTRRTLGFIADETIPQEAVGPVLSQLLGQRHAQTAAWGHLEAHWPALRARIGDMGISRVVEAVGALLPEHRAAVVAFFEANPPAGAERALARALENMDQAAELRTRVTKPLVAHFTQG